eukprot:Stramenopile-MAST_4_protein_3020
MASLAERFSERMREAKSLQAAADKARKDAQECKKKEKEFDDQAAVFKEEEDKYAGESNEQRQRYIQMMSDAMGQDAEKSNLLLDEAESSEVDKLPPALQKYAAVHQKYVDAKAKKDSCIEQARDMATSADNHEKLARDQSLKASKIAEAVEEEKERQRSTEELEKEMKRMWGPEYVLTPDKLPDALVNAVMRTDATVKALEKRYEESLESQRTNYESRFELMKEGFERRIEKLENFVEKQIERYEATNKSTALSPRELYDYYARGTRNFAGVVLAGNFLFGMTFENCDFRDANLEGCDLRNTRFSKCKFDRANLKECRFDYAVLEECTFAKEAKMNNCTLECATLNQCNFTSADLSDANFSEATLMECNLSTVSLPEECGAESKWSYYLNDPDEIPEEWYDCIADGLKCTGEPFSISKATLEPLKGAGVVRPMTKRSDAPVGSPVLYVRDNDVLSTKVNRHSSNFDYIGAAGAGGSNFQFAGCVYYFV